MEEYRDTLIAISQIARKAMNQASKVIRRCDPNKQIESMNVVFFFFFSILFKL